MGETDSQLLQESALDRGEADNEEVVETELIASSRHRMARKHMRRDSEGVATGDELNKDEFRAKHGCKHTDEIETAESSHENDKCFAMAA